MQVVTSSAVEPGRSDGRIDASVAGDIARWLRGETGADNVRVIAFERLPGGAIQDNWLLDVEVDGGPWQGAHGFVLRTDALSGVSASLTRAQEYAVLRAAHVAGVIAPEPVFLCSDLDIIGRVFFIMRRIRGIAAGHRLTREPLLVPDGDALAESLGANLARIHAIRPPRAELAALRRPSANHALATIAEYRAYLDTLEDAYPGLEWALRWCETHAPEPWDVTLIHRDYRTGNYLVDGGHLTAVLDWEFAGWEIRARTSAGSARAAGASAPTRARPAVWPRSSRSCEATKASPAAGSTATRSTTGRRWRTCAGPSSRFSRLSGTSPAASARSSSRLQAASCTSSNTSCCN